MLTDFREKMMIKHSENFNKEIEKKPNSHVSELKNMPERFNSG